MRFGRVLYLKNCNGLKIIQSQNLQNWLLSCYWKSGRGPTGEALPPSKVRNWNWISNSIIHFANLAHYQLQNLESWLKEALSRKKRRELFTRFRRNSRLKRWSSCKVHLLESKCTKNAQNTLSEISEIFWKLNIPKNLRNGIFFWKKLSFF